MRCPACGARNSDAAAWCTQCYAALQGSGPVAPPPAAPAGPPPGSGDAPRPDAAARDVRTVDGEVEWRCGTCDGWTHLDRGTCATCGAPRRGFGELPPPPSFGPDARSRLVIASILVPGLGHLVARRVGSGLARLLLAASWAVAALIVLLGAGSGPGRLPAVPLLVGSLVVWVGSVADVGALVDGRRELLRPRVLSWLTGGVLLTLVLTSALVAGRAGP